MAELVDAADSKSVVRKDVGVRVSLGAPSFFLILKSKKVENTLTKSKCFLYLMTP